jgi:glycine cleavage system H lipoate-binding protein
MARQTQASKSKTPVVFNMTNQECLWSKAGVTAPRPCHNAFDCISCSFDKAMQRRKSMGWLAAGLDEPGGDYWTRENWARLPADERYCRHMLTGRVPFKLCINAYNCGKCAYDQMLDDELLAAPAGDTHLTAAAGFLLPEDYYFHTGHTWARVEYGGRVRVGLDDFAARLFGPVDEFRLPQLGMAARGGGLEFGFSRQGRQARAASPVEGVVVARNPNVLNRAATVNEHPYDDGWLVLLEPTRMQRDLKGLLTGEQSVHWMEREAQRLSDVITTDTGQRLAATGGQVVPDVFGSVPGLNWNELVNKFLTK